MSVKMVIYRLIMVAEMTYTIQFFACQAESNAFYAGFVCVAIIIAETVFQLTKRQARDFYWFSFSILAFSSLFIGLMWYFTKNKTALKDYACTTNYTTYDYLIEKYDAPRCIPVKKKNFFIVFFLIF
jgi:hypothetical protein